MKAYVLSLRRENFLPFIQKLKIFFANVAKP